MSIANTITYVVTAVGIPSIIGGAIYIGRKLQVLDTVKDEITSVKTTVANINERFIRVEERVQTLWQEDVASSQSPRQLNERGKSILNESGIKQIVEAKKEKLLAAVKAISPSNAYDAEQAALDVVGDLPKHCPDVIPQLKDGAFKAGQSIDTVLLVGGFHLRDMIFPELGFSTTDLDKPKPE